MGSNHTLKAGESLVRCVIHLKHKLPYTCVVKGIHTQPPLIEGLFLLAYLKPSTNTI